MKKNRMMRLASVLLVCVLLTTSVISGTFAKYVTSGSASDNARVAAWGFGDATTITFDLFDDVYGSTVDSVDGEKVIAPGTFKDELVELNYADTTGLGAPEVAYTVDLNVTAWHVDPAIEANDNIKWHFNDQNFDKFEDMVAAIEAYTEYVKPNKLPKLTNTGIDIGWNWEFSTSDAADVVDTAMGNANPLDTVSLTIEYVATQVD